MADRRKRNTIMISIGGAISALALFGAVVDLPDKVDPLVHTEAEAIEEHEIIVAQADTAEQTQAGFNAYTLRALMEQEIEILKLQIEAEKDADERKALKRELESKEEFIRNLEEEERKQLMKKGDG
jgi:ribonuclease PH